MRKRKLVVVGFLFVVSVFVGSFFLFKSLNKNSVDYISSVLKKPAYSYLPVEAKNYIREVYDETGEVLLTEKNKKEGYSYLNPLYVNYLTLSSEEQKTYSYIPPEVISDYVYGTNPITEEFPSTYNLSNVDGKNYTTPVRNQGSSGLCWAFSSNSQVESLILKSANESYNENSVIFSERQVDYATSYNGMVDKYSSSYNSGSRILYVDGSSINGSWSLMLDGLGLVSNSWESGIETSTNKLEANQVYKFSNSLYEVDSAVSLPDLNVSNLDLTKEEDVLKREEYIDSIKDLVKNYGGAVVGTISPEDYCSISAGNNNRLIYYDYNYCSYEVGHAMQIIGWDDNYEYKFCKVSGGFSEDVTNCSSENLVEGKGVWILKNSWGEYLPNPYLAYDSYNIMVSAVKEYDTKDWDNFYYYGKSHKEYVTKKNSNKEKIEKIKINFPANFENSSVDIYISSDDDSDHYTLVGNVWTTFDGYYTIDLSDKNYYFEGNKLYVRYKKSSDNNYWLGYGDSVRVYTSNIDEESYIYTDDYTYDGSYVEDNSFTIRLNQTTIGIPEDSVIDYKILDSDGNEITAEYSYSENTVFANNIFSKIKIDASLGVGEYKIQSIYNGVVKSSSRLIVKIPATSIEGSGTENDPYIITTPTQLYLIKNYTAKFFELGNDIDLTYDTQNENGLFYNNGLGWEPIDYIHSTLNDKSGIRLNGNGHKIKGLYINRPNEDFVGLFRAIYSYTEDYSFGTVGITNLTLEDANVTGRQYVGGLVGGIDGISNIYQVYLQNVSVIGGSVSGTKYVGGIAGKFSIGVYNEEECDLIYSLFNSASITADNYAGGLFGYAENAHLTSYMDIYIKNVINMGNVTANNGDAAGIIGNLNLKNGNLTYIENALNIGTIKGTNCSAGITCSLTEYSNGTYALKNVYYIDDFGYDEANTSTTATNVKKIEIKDLVNSSTYSEWTSFDTYWNLSSIDGINRVPSVKSMTFDYINSTSPTIELGVLKTVDLTDVISSTYDLNYYILDSDIATVNDGVLTGKKSGSTYLVVSSKYEKLFISVSVSDIEYTISFDSNTGVGEMESVVKNAGSNYVLAKNTFTKDNYYFVSWNTKEDGTGDNYLDESEILVTSDLKLYAIWALSSDNYTVIFYSYDEKENSINTYSYDANYSFNNYDWSIKEGYKFKEWNTEKDGTGTSYKVGENFNNLVQDGSNIINLYEVIEPIKYKIVFYANNDTEDTYSKEYTYDLEEKLAKNTFTRAGFTFKEWNTKKDRTGTSYSDEESVINLAKTENAVVELYAQWNWDGYTIGYYEWDEENKYISSVSVGTTLEEFVSYINLSSNYSVKVDTKDVDGKKIIYTGGKTKIYKDDELYAEYTNVVIGDVNGNAIIDIIDYIRIMKDIMETQKLSGPYLKAADVNQNGSIDIIDYIRIMKMIMEEN